LFLGNFYLDENNFLGGIWQGFSRHTWESLNSFVGHSYSQIRNTGGLTDHVKYFGGATFSIRENVDEFNNWRGVSLGNYINAKIENELNIEFSGGWIYSENGLFWHEYGHTKDSKLFGLTYLLAIGIPSASGADWTELRANNRAWDYARNRGLMDEWMYPNSFPLK
jgi:hypothetical protein